ncbi:MAG: hypothetical protein AAFX99_33790, partial [Myxococcota bacterium]
MTLSLTGKVISTASPHLPGHPTIDLSWPTANWIRGDQCHMRAHGTCIEFLQGEIHGATLGGRTFAAEPQDCISPEAPWLVPEFEPTRACQSPDVVAVSPLLDGISRSRQIRTIDGALIDKSLFFLIFEEQIEGFPAPRYSYALLRRTPEPMESWPDPVWSEPTPLDPAPACSEALIDELRESGQNQHVGKTFEEWAINALINRLSPFGPDGWSLLDRIFSYRDVWRAGDAPTRVPSVCSNRNDPYCFDPGQIDEVHSWLSCLTSVPRIEGPHSLADRLEWFMENDFAPAVELGLELMLVLGDDAMIHGLEAPWLEPMPEATFSGSAFEVGGIDAGGLLGAELTALYRATQLYQLALDRGMTLAPALLEAGHNGRALDLLHRASTQKARTWALIGSIYNSIGQVALAHQVAQRATSQHHLEATWIVGAMGADGRIEAQARSRAANQNLLSVLLHTRTDEGRFPGLHDEDLGVHYGFDDALVQVRDRLAQATALDQQAMESARDEAVPSAEQQQLNNDARRALLNAQLTELCGTLDNAPATRRHIATIEQAWYGDPCGHMATGSIAGLAA